MAQRIDREIDVEGFPSQMMGLGPIDGAQIFDRRSLEPREVGGGHGNGLVTDPDGEAIRSNVADLNLRNTVATPS